jgi:MarR family transcriptional regulator, organic hydroperoxide resistance regulator
VGGVARVCEQVGVAVGRRDVEVVYPQYLAMLVVWEHGEMSVKRLSERLRLDPGTVSPLLKRMERAGLVRRARSANDERSVTILLTAEGKALRRRVVGVPLETLDATGLDREGLVDLRARLKQLTAALEDSLREA